MSYEANQLDQLKALSVKLGNNQSIVQGPGGNISLKNADHVWVKSSGANLSDAETKEIFVRVGRLTGKPDPENQELKPSIETNLHLTLSANVVAHTHSTVLE